jgi:hypothetical protein
MAPVNRENLGSQETQLFMSTSRTRLKLNLFWLGVLGLPLSMAIVAMDNAKGGGSGSGLEDTNTKAEQKELAQKILSLEKDAVIDPNTGYAFCPRGRTILPEELNKFQMCGHELILKQSIGERLQAANETCMRTKNVCISVYSTLRSNLNAENSSKKRKGWWKQNFGSKAASGNCNTTHLIGQTFDVLNFDKSHECLVEQGFNGGWAGVQNDPHHYYDPKTDIIPVLKGADAALRTARNKAWCLSDGPCRRNNLRKRPSSLIRSKKRYHKSGNLRSKNFKK